MRLVSVRWLTSNRNFQCVKMEIFQLTRRNFSKVGIDARQSIQGHLFNARNVGFFGVLILGTILNFIFTFYVANTFIECIDSAKNGSSIVICGLIFLSNILNVAKVFEFIAGLEILIEKSKCVNLSRKPAFLLRHCFIGQKSISKYDKSKHQIEMWSKRLYICLSIFIPCLSFGMFAMSFFNYFTTDLDSDAFQLPLPMW